MSAEDGHGVITKLISQESRTKSGRTAAIVEAVNIKFWSSGLYKFNFIVSDSLREDSAQFLLRIISPREVELAIKESARDEKYDTLSLNDKMNLIKYELNSAQKSALGKLTEQGQDGFLRDFWEDRKALSSTKDTESRDELIRRYLFVNDNFSLPGPTKAGWKTDRGRIYMTHGHWDELDDYQLSDELAPFQVWHYHRLGGKQFVFQDLTGDNDYQLVHSNLTGERYDPVWENRIKSGFLDLE
jgi:GWxTD domain-containing protein